MVPPSSVRVSRVRTYSGYRSLVQCFAYEILTLFDRPSHAVRLHLSILYTILTPPPLPGTVWPLPLSLATTRGISFDFSSSGYLDVSVPRVPHAWLCIHHTFRRSSRRWFPNSDIRGSLIICISPRLFAACHVLRRLPIPRHSPYALYSLNFSLSSSFSSCVFFVIDCCLFVYTYLVFRL